MKFLSNIQVGGQPNFTLPLSDGTNGQVLTTDGSGNVTWSTPITGVSSVAFDDLTNKEGGTGRYATAGDFISGEMGLTTNDGFGKSNITFNHADGIPQVSGSSARITFNTALSTGANMQFQMEEGVTADGTSQSLTQVMTLSKDRCKFTEYVSHQGDDNTYVRFTTDRIRIGAGGTVYFDTNNPPVDELDTSSHDYISLSGQTLELGAIDYDTDIINLPTLYQSWDLDGVTMDGVSVEFPMAYASGSGSSADPAIYYSTLMGANGLTATPSTNTVSLDSDLRDHVTFVGSNFDYHRYDIKGRLSSYVNSTASSGGTVSEQLRLVHNDAHFAGDVTAFSSTLSDERLKTDIETIEKRF